MTFGTHLVLASRRLDYANLPKRAHFFSPRSLCNANCPSSRIRYTKADKRISDV